MRRQDWTTIRVRTETRALLHAAKEALHQRYQAGKVELPADQADGVSFDYFLRLLLDRDEAHRERARRQGAGPSGDGPDAL